MTTPNDNPTTPGLTTQPPAGNGGSPFGAGEGAPPAPAAAPQPPAPPAPAPKVEIGDTAQPEVKPDPSTEQGFEYDPTGNPGLDYALAFVGGLGYGPNHPAMIQAQSGNFDLIAAELALKGVKGSEAVVALAKSAYTEMKAKADAAGAELVKTAHSIAGSEANWSAVQAWASANADAGEKAAINAALRAGGFQAQSAIRELVRLYSEQNTLNKAPAPVATPGAGSSRGTTSEGGPLSAHEYGKAVADLAWKTGQRDVSGMPEYAELQARRLAGIRAGK